VVARQGTSNVWRHLMASLIVLDVGAGVAQGQAVQANRNPLPRWELDAGVGVGESAGGALTSTLSSVGDGTSFTTPGSFAQLDRSVSSWFLSPSGTFLMPGIQSLAPTVQSPGASGRLRGLASAHGTLWVTRRVGFEASASYGVGAPAQLDNPTLAAIERSRASFQASFGALFGGSPGTYGAPSATAVTQSSTTSGGVLVLVGGVNLSKGTGRTRPFVTIGGGERTPIGAVQSVTLTGHYSFVSPSGVPIQQTDAVTMHYGQGHAVVFDVGGGVRRFVTARSGLRVEAIGFVGHASDHLSVDVLPSAPAGTPAGFVVQNPPLSNGTIVFSNTPSQRSTLSGPPVTNLVTATGSSWRWVWQVTASWFWRF
jgi:hypothetical protein